jgi:hypothetical protein
MTDLRKFDRAFAQSNRLRTQGLDYLLAAARQAGVRRIVVQSYCGWPYARTGQRLKSEDDALDPDPPEEMRRSLDAIRYLERATTTSGLEGVVLRYGAFYGPDTGMLSAAALNQVRRRRFPLIGDGNGWWSFCTSTMPLPPPPSRSSAAPAAFTTSWTTSPRLHASGFRSWPGSSGQGRRSTCPRGSRESSPASTWSR